MSVIKAGPAVPNWVAAAIVGVLLGGVGGYYAASWDDDDRRPGGSAPGGPGGGMGGGMMGGGGGGMMGGGGGGGAQAHPQAAALVRTVSSLAVLEKARGQELTADQRTRLANAVEPLAAGGKMTEADAEARIKEINAILTPTQVTTVDELLPRPGGGRSGGAPSRGAAPPGGAPSGPAAASRPSGGNSPAPGGMRPQMSSPAGMMPAPAAGGGGPGGGMGMMGGMGGGGIDYEQPFKEGRGKDRLTELLASLKK